MKRTALAVGLAVGLLGAAYAAPLSAEVDWMTALPGVEVVTSQRSPHHVELVCATPSDTMATVRKGLLQRGWHVDADTSVNGQVGALQAHKGRERLEIAVGAGTLTVDLSDAPRPVDDVADAPAPGGALTINDSAQQRTVRCDGPVTLNGSECMLTLTGRVTAMTVNGSNNQITVDGSLGPVTLNGSQIQLRWSRRANPREPLVHNNGSNNQVMAVP